MPVGDRVDVMLDRYWFGDVSRISPEAPVPVVRIERREERLGGAANVARNAAALGADAVSGVNINMIGWIMMLAGLLAILLSFVMARGRRDLDAGYTSTRRTMTDPNTGETVDRVDVERDRGAF